jgi:carotenoid cleavage dioxygenase-like enzyme
MSHFLICCLRVFLQSNFAPVDELNEPRAITSIEGKVPYDFPEGVYIRNGLFLKSTIQFIQK